MQEVSKFQWHADKFRMMAKRAQGPEQKATFSKMAEMWENLAEEREAQSMIRRSDALESSNTGATPGVATSDKR